METNEPQQINCEEWKLNMFSEVKPTWATLVL